MMKRAVVKNVGTAAFAGMDVKEVAGMLDNASVEYHSVNIVNWKKYGYKPEVRFRIAYSSTASEIYLQYKVKENGIRATFGCDSGSKPYKDDCVEFFMSPECDSCYYNLEMNCIGVGTFAYHSPDNPTVHFGDEVVSKIRRVSSLGNEAFGMKEGEYEWTLVIAIPLELYSLDGENVVGKEMRANFYKCGDDTAVPHYLSWNPIPIEKPSFHRPDHFGSLVFE